MEATTDPLTWLGMPSTFRTGFLFMRSPGIGWLMISVADMFVKKMLPELVHRGLTPAAQAYYASAFPTTVASRKAVRQWPRVVPISGKPADNVAVIKAYGEWLTHTPLPKSCSTRTRGSSSEKRKSRGAGKNMPIFRSSISVMVSTSFKRTTPA